MPDRRFIHTHPGFGYRFQPQPSRDVHMRGRRPTETDCHAPAGHDRGRAYEAHGRDAARCPRRPGERSPATTIQRRRSDQEQDRRARGRARARARPRRVRQLEQSSSSSSTRATPRPQRPPATISGAGSTFAAPVYEQWASAASSGLTRQLPGRRLGRGHHLARGQDRRLRRQRPAAEAGRRSRDRQERQPRRSRSRCSWARSPSPTTCPA